MSGRHNIIPDVHLILVKSKQVLMLRRFNTGFEDGNYGLIGGHVDHAESIRHAMHREAYEEAGILVDPSHLVLVHTMHRVTDEERVSFFFTAKGWSGEPANMERSRCDDMGWRELDALPVNTVGFVRQALRCYLAREPYSEFGWP